MSRTSDEPIDAPERAEISIDEVLRALADPVRLSMIRQLAAHPHADAGVACGEIPLGINKSTRTHHLRVLRLAGVIAMRTEGTRRLVTLRAEDLNARFPGVLTAILHP
ncbi:ArsR/SmtB family transcription factor [Microlunatus speluncae]|uniref:ArsR/SmtB family transcription factor n=1 Tax=Microlunatus speluncae TaxID=2594267 RepID=UPI0012663099|nr:helix-turn-helix domain-containing protein [Microlunatus speluncae]